MTDTIASSSDKKSEAPKKRGRPAKSTSSKNNQDGQNVIPVTPEVINKDIIHYRVLVGSNSPHSDVPRHLEDRTYHLDEILKYASMLKKRYPQTVFYISPDRDYMIVQNLNNLVTEQVGLKKDPEALKRFMSKVARSECLSLEYDIGTQEGACRLAEHLSELAQGKEKTKSNVILDLMVEGEDNGAMMV